MPPLLSTQLDQTLVAAERSFESGSIDDYEELSRQIGQTETMAREAYQEKLKRDYWSLVEKLEAGASLTPAEQEALKLLVVGEAQLYLKYENDFENWQDELKRLATEMERIRSDGLEGIEDIMGLQALCREAKRVLPDLLFYLREQRRIRRFEQATASPIDAETGKFLAEFVKEILLSDRM